MKDKKEKAKKFLIFSIIIMAIPLVFYSLADLFVGDIVDAATKIKKLDKDLYYTEFTGDYDLMGYINNGGISVYTEIGKYINSNPNSKKAFGCSTIVLSDSESKVYYGRNYDSNPTKGIIIHSIPKNGYESFSTCDIGLLNLGEEFEPTESIISRMFMLSSIYYPVDGMNSEGLFVACLTNENSDFNSIDTEKNDINIFTSVRLLLDYAKNTDEAFSLLEKYDMKFDDTCYQLFISDKEGKSIVVSYIDGKPEKIMSNVLTNHSLSDLNFEGESKERLDILKNYDFGDMDTIKEALNEVKASNFKENDEDLKRTIWSVRYNPNNLEIYFNFNENFDRTFKLIFGKEGNWEIM